MELLPLVCSQGTSVIREILENRDMCIALVCTKYKRIGIRYIHDPGKYFVAVGIPYSTLISNERIATAYNKTLLLE
jgi:hypothetical protein